MTGSRALASGDFAKRFRIERAVGSGGMGTVYRALDEKDGAIVALKLLQGHGAPQERERFAREAALLSQLQHPYVVRYVAHGTSDDGEPYLAMEWLDGEDLGQRLVRGPLSLQDTVALAQAIGSALAAAHDHGITHRDIKPGNIFLRNGEVRSPALLDFGIARRSLRGKTLTQTGAVVGTPEYMAPEQARGLRDVGPAADLFSLGCVLYECLAGRPPFIGEHVAAVLVKILFEDPPPIHTFRPRVPGPLVETISRMLRKDAGLRLGNARTLVAALTDDALEDALARDAQALNETLPAGAPDTVPGDEQRLYSVVVLVPAADTLGPTVAPTLTPQQQQARLAPFQTLRDHLETLGTKLEALADGSIIATVPPSASAADQAMLAVRCALLMKERMPDAAVAVATGKGQLREQIPIGEAVDRALRLLEPTMQLARGQTCTGSHDGVRLDSLSQHLLDSRIVIEHRDGTAVALREHEEVDASRPLLGRPTPCVGREQELGFLESALVACVDESQARAIAVLGDAGMGKSRLRHELIRRGRQLNGDITLLQGRSDMMSRGSPYATFGHVVRRHCEIQSGDAAELQRTKLQKRIGRHLPESVRQRAAWFLGELCGVSFPGEQHQELLAARRDPKVMHAQINAACVAWLRAEAEAAPIALVLEDFHWADVLSAQIIEVLLRDCAELPLLVLLFSRPEAREQFPSLFQPQRMQELVLRPLSKRACERFANQVLRSTQGAELRPELVASVVQQCAGHPLLLEELIRAAAGGQSHDQAETVLALLQARLSTLDPLSRRLVRYASVFGEVFPDAALIDMLGGETNKANVEASLLQLSQREFVEQLPESRWADANLYRFRHALLREAAYALLSDAEKVALHAVAATALIRLGESDPLVIANHYRRASLPNNAVPWLLKAAELAQNKHDIPGSVELASEALAGGPTADEQGRLLGIQVMGLLWLDQHEDLIPKAIHALSLTKKGSRLWMQIASHSLMSMISMNRQLEIGLLIASIAGVTPEEDAVDAYCECLCFLSAMAGTAGQRQPAEMYVSMLEKYSTKMLPFRGLAYASFASALHYREQFLGSETWKSYLWQKEASSIFEKIGDRWQFIHGNNFLALRLAELGFFEKSMEHLESIDQNQLRNNKFYRTLTMLHIFLVCHMYDRMDLASQATAWLDIQMAPGSSLNKVMAGVYCSTLSLIKTKEGSVEEALPLAHSAMKQLVHCPVYALRTHEALMRAHVRQGHISEAKRATEQGVECLHRLGKAGAYELPFRLALVETKLACGCPQEAMAALRDALDGLKLRADRILDPSFRGSYVDKNPDNVRLRELSRTLLGRDPFA